MPGSLGELGEMEMPVAPSLLPLWVLSLYAGFLLDEAAGAAHTACAGLAVSFHHHTPALFSPLVKHFRRG